MSSSGWRSLLVFGLCVFGVGCKQQSEPGGPVAVQAPKVEAPAVAPAAEPAKPPSDALVDLSDLKVKRLPDGKISVTGTDRWGAAIDSTYESASYFKNAVPVLERALLPERAEALKRAADGLAAAAQ